MNPYSNNDQVREILSRVPSWMTRWGITAIAFLVSMFLILSYFIQYPDVINSSVTITTNPPATSILSAASGHIFSVDVKDQQKISKNQVLASLKKKEEVEHILYLEKHILDLNFHNYEKNKTDSIFNYGDAYFSDLQPAYDNFKSVKNKLLNLKRYSSKQYESGHENRLLLEKSCADLLQKIRKWKSSNLIISPSDGVINFYNPWYVGNYINKNDKFALLLPPRHLILTGSIIVKASEISKVKLGQRVNIKLETYPYQEFGQIKAKVIYISSISQDNKYLVEVNFPDGLQTSYLKRVPYKYNMRGTADIITEEVSLIGRIFYRFRPLFHL